MEYCQHLPHPLLREYIDAYWIVRNDDRISHTTRILPDGCIDIIINAGDDYLTSEGLKVKHEEIFLVGTMMQYIDAESMPWTKTIGIRFKPLGFTAFYQFNSLHEITDKTIDVDEVRVPFVPNLDSETINTLDKFFIGRLSRPSNMLNGVLSQISGWNGNITVEKLSREFAISKRKLERDFKQHLGVTPKEFINFKRYEYAMQRIRNRPQHECLLDIALDCGYYDHSHLTNEVRRYSGSAPSIV